MDVIIYDLVEQYIKDKVSKEIKDEFINAALHFNINNTLYKKYKPIQIEAKINEIQDDQLKDYVEIICVYGYILFRLIKENKFKKEDRIEGLQLIIEINNSITNYIRNKITDEELKYKIENILIKMKLKEEDNNKIIKLLNQ